MFSHNVLDVEALALEYSHNHSYGAIFLLDYCAAFPSLNRDFLWHILFLIGIPPFVIIAIACLYKDNHLWICFNGIVKNAFCMLIGVRQGCPLSSILFVLATDVINRYVDKCLHGIGHIRSYADDNALIVQMFFKAFVLIRNMLGDIGNCTHFRLNFNQSFIIPLWHSGGDDVRAFLSKCDDLWSEVIVDTKGKYIGFYTGPGAGHNGWCSVTSKYKHICAYISSLGLPIFQRFYYTTCLLFLFSNIKVSSERFQIISGN